MYIDIIECVHNYKNINKYWVVTLKRKFSKRHSEYIYFWSNFVQLGQNWYDVNGGQ